MRLFEYEGREIFARHGITVPPAVVVRAGEDVAAVGDKLGYPVIIKAQVLSGGRGKAGGVKVAQNRAELVEHSQKIFGLTIQGEKTECVLVSGKAAIAQELYAGVTFDPQNGLPVVMFSTNGGVEIEEVAKKTPDQVFKMHVAPTRPVREFEVIDFLRKTTLAPALLPKVAQAVHRLIQVFFDSDALIAEINPLAITPDNGVIALDSKMVIDDSALRRQHITPRFETSSPLEVRAKEAGLNYVQLEGNIAVLGSGAGLAMATMDLISYYGAKPACFLDTGGGISSEKMSSALRICLATPGVVGVLVNAFGGINNCEWMGRGIATVIDADRPKVPILVKMRGHSQDEGWRLLEERNVPVVKFGSTEEAVRQIVSMVGGGR